MIVGDAHGPATFGRITGAGQVAAETDDDAAPGAFRRGLGRAVGAPGLRGRAQIQLDAVRHPDRSPRAIDLHAVPTGDVMHEDAQRGTVAIEGGKVAVVPDLPHRGTDRGIDQPVGRARPVHRDVECIEETVGDRDVVLGLRVDAGEVGVGAEATAGVVDFGDDALHLGERLRQCALVGAEHHGSRPQRGERRRAGCARHDCPETIGGGGL